LQRQENEHTDEPPGGSWHFLFHCRASVDDHVILHNGMARVSLDDLALIVGREMPRSQGHRLIDADPFTNDRGLADHHAGAVINEEARADAGAWMNIDARLGMRDLGDQTCDQGCSKPVQRMPDPMVNDGNHSGIADQDFGKIRRRWVADEGGPKVADEHTAEIRQRRRKRPHQLDGPLQCLIEG
jgi:hypothetical protein